MKEQKLKKLKDRRTFKITFFTFSMEIREIRGIKTLFAHAKYEIELDKDSLRLINIKEKRVGIVSNIQTSEVLEEIKDYLQKKNQRCLA